MLVIERKKQERIIIPCESGEIEIKVLGFIFNNEAPYDDTVRLGFNAPKSVPIYREEIYEREPVEESGYQRMFATVEAVEKVRHRPEPVALVRVLLAHDDSTESVLAMTKGENVAKIANAEPGDGIEFDGVLNRQSQWDSPPFIGMNMVYLNEILSVSKPKHKGDREAGDADE